MILLLTGGYRIATVMQWSAYLEEYWKHPKMTKTIYPWMKVHS